MSLPSRSIQFPESVQPPRSERAPRLFRGLRDLAPRTCRVDRSPLQFHVDLQFVLLFGVEELERHGLGRLNEDLLLSRQDLGEIDRTPSHSVPRRHHGPPELRLA